MRSLALLGALLGAALLAACASIPEDRGLSAVDAQLAARGGPSLPPPDARNDALVEQILRQGPLDADGAVRIALLANPALRAEYARLGIAAAEVYDAGRLSNPVLAASAGFTSHAGDVNRYDFGLSQNFLDLLLLPARTRLAQAQFERTQQQAGAAVLDLDSQVRSAWYRLVAARQIETLRRSAAEAAAVSAELAQRYYAAGNIPLPQLELEQAEALQAQAAVPAATQDSATARATLGRLMGLAAPRDDWQVQDGLPPVPAPLDDEAALLTLAQRSRLDLAAKLGEVTAQEDALGLAHHTRYLGQIDLGANTERDSDGARLTGPSIAVELPLFNQGDGTLLRAQARLERSRSELEALELEIGHGVRTARQRTAAAQALAARYAGEVMPLQARMVEHTRQRANAMLESPFELIRAQRQTDEAERQSVEAARDYWLARSELEREVGARLPQAAMQTAGAP